LAAPPSYDWTLDEVTASGLGDFTVALPEPFTLLPEDAEKLPGGTQQFTVDGSEGPFTWSVHGVVGGDATFGTIDGNGFYTAPGAVPSPATFDVCAALVGNPAAFACSEVTINPIPTAGEDVVVFNDLNIFDNGALNMEPQNETLIANLVNYVATGSRATSGTEVWWDLGHSPSCSSGTCGGGSSNMSKARGVIQAEGFTFVAMSSSVGDLAVIPAQVKVIWLWMPTIAYTRDEINAFKKFASEGGRIIFVGEHGGFYPEFAIENQFLADMGAQMTNQGAFINCGRNLLPQSQIATHQVTTGMTSAAMGCASQVIPGPNDFVLLRSGGSDLPIAGVAKIDVTPLPAPAPGPAKIVVPVSHKKTHDSLGNPIKN
jgi:hypothetical protein